MCYTGMRKGWLCTMRKLFAMLMAAMLLLSVAACDAGSTDSGSEFSDSEPDFSVGESEGQTSKRTKKTTTRRKKTTTRRKKTTTTRNKNNTTTSSKSNSVTEKPTADTVTTTDRGGNNANGSDKTVTATKTTTTKKPATTTTTKKPTTATATTRYPVTTTKASAEKTAYLNQSKKTIVGSSSNKNKWVYQLGSEGLMVREAVINSGRGDAAVELVQITDVHFTSVNSTDQSNASTMSSYNQRKNTFTRAQANITRCMKYANYFEQTVITGDTMDFLSYGNLELIRSKIWNVNSNVMIALGNHDPVRVMGLPNDVKDTTTAISRYNIVQNSWKHDIYYTSRVVNNKVMAIQMDNNKAPSNDMVTKLTNDIDKARKSGYTILLFMHEPLVSNNPSETDVEALAPNRSGDNAYVLNFYGGNGYTYGDANKTKKWSADFFGGNHRSGNEKKVWQLITTNADVVGGVFSGHWHANFYSEIKATTKSGTQKIIPQYVLAGAFHDGGHVLRITVK